MDFSNVNWGQNRDSYSKDSRKIIKKHFKYTNIHDDPDLQEYLCERYFKLNIEEPSVGGNINFCFSRSGEYLIAWRDLMYAGKGLVILTLSGFTPLEVDRSAIKPHNINTGKMIVLKNENLVFETNNVTQPGNCKISDEGTFVFINYYDTNINGNNHQSDLYIMNTNYNIFLEMKSCVVDDCDISDDGCFAVYTYSLQGAFQLHIYDCKQRKVIYHDYPSGNINIEHFAFDTKQNMLFCRDFNKNKYFINFNTGEKTPGLSIGKGAGEMIVLERIYWDLKKTVEIKSEIVQNDILSRLIEIEKMEFIGKKYFVNEHKAWIYRIRGEIYDIRNKRSDAIYNLKKALELFPNMGCSRRLKTLENNEKKELLLLNRCPTR